MTLLLDTHTFLWWCLDDPQLSDTARAAIRDNDNRILVSAATAWEIAVKWQLGKLPLPEEPRLFVESRIASNEFEPVDISVRHTLHVSTLPMLHRDPFDRMLVAQSQLEHAPIISTDSTVAQYEVDVLW